MRSGGERLAAEGQDHVLHENAAPTVQIGGVGAEHQEQRERAEYSRDADREDAAQRHRHGHLFADRLGGLHGVEPDLRQLGVDLRRLRSEIGVVHIDVGAENQQQQRDGLEAVAPDAEHAAHLLLVGRGSAGVVPLVALPRHAAVDGVEASDQHVEDIEIGHHAGVEGVDEGVPLGPREHHLFELGETEGVENHSDQQRIGEIAVNPLQAVGDHGGELAAGHHDDERDAEEERHQRAEGGPLQAEQVK